MYDLTAFQRDLLYVVTGLNGLHGLAVKDELDDYYATEIHHGRLYPNLDTLVDKGLVAKGKRDERTNTYRPTARGRRELNERRTWEGRVLGADFDFGRDHEGHEDDEESTIEREAESESERDGARSEAG